MKNSLSLRAISVAAIAACAATAASAQVLSPGQGARNDPGRYTVGDFHNHTTCTDGQISVQRLVVKSVDEFGLDWFIMAGHGGTSRRNCTLVDDAATGEASGFPFVEGQGPNTTWGNSIGPDRIKGDLVGNDTPNAPDRRMWIWQTVQEFEYPVLEKMAELKRKPIFSGLESVVPGHEHGNVALIAGQLPKGGGGNADAMARWAYCFDRPTSDLSRGAENQWDCTVPGGERNEFLDERGRKLAGVQNTGELGHLKLLESLRYKAASHPLSSYYIPAHLERAGIFNPNGNNGWNIEHLRNMNNVAPTVAFGMEGGPGHQANNNRSYSANAAGRGTYGGAGYYTAKLGGVWDTLLGEGRNWWIFNNSDYHNRGAFGPDDPRSTNDQYPGEFNKSYIITRSKGGPITPQDIVDGMRSGNSYFVNGDLIDRMSYVVCKTNNRAPAPNGIWPFENQIAAAAAAGTGFSNPNCAQQGQKLVVNPGQDVVVMVVLRDPEGPNRAPYTIPNPSLLQIGINQPLNQPVLHHVDLIGAPVTGYVPPESPLYAGAAPGGRQGQEDSPNATNPNTAVLATWNEQNWKSLPGGWKRMFFRISNVQDSQYLRLRGTNIPAGTPNETDADGNPLLDSLADNITIFPTEFEPACADPAVAPTILNCLTHLPAQNGGRRLNNDVEAFTDLWFYSNPVYIEVKGGVKVAGVK
jgi:hypothetical protein